MMILILAGLMRLSRGMLSWLSGSSGTVCCVMRTPACTICCRKNETRQRQTVCATPRLSNCSQPELGLINFDILFSDIACDITIGPSIILIYWLFVDLLYQLYQSSHWLLCEINHLHHLHLHLDINLCLSSDTAQNFTVEYCRHGRRLGSRFGGTGSAR